MQYLGSNNVEGVAESWVEAELRWVMEVELVGVGCGWRWVHGLVIPYSKSLFKDEKMLFSSYTSKII